MTDEATKVPDTFVRTFDGRDILFRFPIPGQLIILRRRLMKLGQLSEQAKDEGTRLQLGSQVIIDTLELVESLIVNPEDAQFLEDAMLRGKVGHEEVMDILTAKREENKPAKKAAKTVASRGRTRR